VDGHRPSFGLRPGEAITSGVEDRRPMLAKTEDFLRLAGSVQPPPERPITGWDRVRTATRRARAERLT
jgi:hypothetical protein